MNGAALTGTITAITLWKNSTLGWKEIVKIWLKIEDGQVVNEITWTDTDLRNRATIINQKVSPSNQAGLQIEIIVNRKMLTNSQISGKINNMFNMYHIKSKIKIPQVAAEKCLKV
jgi:hypothetical protein